MIVKYHNISLVSVLFPLDDFLSMFDLYSSSQHTVIRPKLQGFDRIGTEYRYIQSAVRDKQIQNQ